MNAPEIPGIAGALKTNRREFLRTSGRLLIGFQMLPLGGLAPGDHAAPHPVAGNGKTIDSWLKFDSEGILTVITGKMELGQGIRTALMQMAAEELDIRWTASALSSPTLPKRRTNATRPGAGRSKGAVIRSARQLPKRGGCC